MPIEDWMEPKLEDETGGPYCEWCGEEKEYDDLVEVDNSDRSVGYVSIDWMCSECRGKRRVRWANGY